MKKLLSFPHVGTMGTAHGNDGCSTWEHRTDFETIKNRLDSFTAIETSSFANK